jgi:hypothetical protein
MLGKSNNCTDEYADENEAIAVNDGMGFCHLLAFSFLNFYGFCAGIDFDKYEALTWMGATYCS